MRLWGFFNKNLPRQIQSNNRLVQDQGELGQIPRKV